eukprot:4404032-Amphidinium_carterae.1
MKLAVLLSATAESLRLSTIPTIRVVGFCPQLVWLLLASLMRSCPPPCKRSSMLEIGSLPSPNLPNETHLTQRALLTRGNPQVAKERLIAAITTNEPNNTKRRRQQQGQWQWQPKRNNISKQ